MPQYGDIWLAKDNRPYLILRVHEYAADASGRFEDHTVLLDTGASRSGVDETILEENLHWKMGEVSDVGLAMGTKNYPVIWWSGGLIIFPTTNQNGEQVDMIDNPYLAGLDTPSRKATKGILGVDVLAKHRCKVVIDYSARTAGIFSK